MKKESKNWYTWNAIFLVPFLLASFLVGVLKIYEFKFLFVVGPLGVALFHFRGKVWWKNWYSKLECFLWGIGWLILAGIILQKIS